MTKAVLDATHRSSKTKGRIQRKKERFKSIDLKAKKESSDDETLTSGSDDEEYAMAVRNFKKFFRRKGKFVRQPREEKKSFRQRDEKKGKNNQKCLLEATESLSQTYTRYKTLLNELTKDGVNLSKHEINVGFMNSLLEKWLTISQGFRNANHTQTLDLADFYGRFVYEDNLIQRRISKKNYDDEVDGRSMTGYSSVSKAFQPKFTPKLIQSSKNSIQADPKVQKDYKAEYKKMKAKLTLLEANPSTSQTPKTFQPKNKGLVAETFDWDEEEWMLKEYDWCQELSAQICRATRTDNGTEFKNQEPESFCDKRGISQNFSSPYTPKQNDVAERKNKTLIKAARTMLNGSVLSKHFWTDAVRIAYYTQNRSIIVKRHDKTSYEIFKERILDISYFHVFGCPVFIHNHKDHLGKFDAKADDGYFLGYSSVSKAFRVYNTRRQKIQETCHVTFHESMEAVSSHPISQDIWSREQHIELVNIIGDPGECMLTRSMTAKLTAASTNECLFANFLSEIEPKKVFEALKHPGWINVMQEELKQFYKNKVWTLVPLSNGKIAIGSKWVYRNKKDEHGITTKNKARLVTQGYSQEEGINYDETFAPVARIEAIRIFLAFATYMSFKFYQMDVKSAFLNGKLKEEVYIKQPPGFESSEFPDYVCKLNKALYGLKQAPKAWYETLSTFLIQNKFIRGRIDNTLFIYKSKEDVLFVQVYVDDIIFGSTSYKLCKQFEKLMTKKFEMSMMGELTYFLGLQIKQDDKGISICQE
ncbi:retrovirus-related pol polyprotein from transposon TNT 1-94 [Tanacetum coccineum]